MSSTTTVVVRERPTNYLNAETTLWSWVSTTDHKRIALLFLGGVLFSLALGGTLALVMRLELLTPAQDLVTSETYNRLFTMHGVIMVWLFLIPSIPTTLGNFFVPMMIGAHDLAFPRLNLASLYVFNLSGAVILYSLVMGGVDTGWTFYTPFSTLFSNGYVFAATLGVFINGFSSIMTSLNFVVTIHRLRAPGMTLQRRLPLSESL